MLIKGSYKVKIDGQDVTSRFKPRLTSMNFSRKAGKAADNATMSLADPGGKIALPADRAPVEITLNKIWGFSGFVSSVKCDLSKGGGRNLSVEASSIEQGSKAKEPSLFHKDDATLRDAMVEFGEKAGLNVEVIGDVGDLFRDYWIQQNESFVSFAQRLAREVGGTFKVIGDRAFFSSRNEGLSVSGRPLSPIDAIVGENVLSASISPLRAKPKYKDVEISYFDIAKGKRISVSETTGIDDVDAILRRAISEVDEETARSRAKSLAAESDREKGDGTITILGDATAEPEAIVNLSGFRPGADGAYRIDGVDHQIDAKGGFTTQLTVKQPQDGAGTDSRT